MHFNPEIAEAIGELLREYAGKDSEKISEEWEIL